MKHMFLVLAGTDPAFSSFCPPLNRSFLMSKRRYASIVLAALLPFSALIHSVAAHADTLDDIKNRGTMTVAIDPTFAPYEYTDANNNIVGYDPAVMAAV